MQVKVPFLKKTVFLIFPFRFGAPAFLSYPHFYLADSFYTDAIVGMKPNASEHQMTMSIEPQTGIPVQVKVAAQINLKVEKIDKIK